jgi:hypothetical protein
MTKVKIDSSPSQQLVDKAKAEAEVTDARGRVLVLRKPGVLAQYRLVEMLGESASNQVYMAMVLPLIYVATIDADPVVVQNKRHIDALIQRLDEDGIQCVMEAVQKHFGETDIEADKAALKN